MPAYGKRRALGQHFLKDRALAQKIAETTFEQARANHCQILLEIGPGRGALTTPLLNLLEANLELPLLLAERDPELITFWRGQAAEHSLIQIAGGDFLELPEEVWLARQPVGVVSNLPYSAGTAILVRLARNPGQIPFMVLMFQAEVARRLRAEIGSKSWGSLTLFIQNHWDVRKLSAVPPESFSPPPDVDSEVVVLTRRAQPRIQIPPGAAGAALWDGLLKASFAHRRKMLRGCFPAGSRHKIALEQSGLDGSKRAEALTWEEWDRFFQALKALVPPIQ